MSEGAPEVGITLTKPVNLPRFARYPRRKRILSSQDREIDVSFRGQKIFTVLVPKTIFNPFTEDPNARTDAKYFVELIMTGVIDVKGKRVVDLGCGCGVIGLACIQTGATSVLFTDINPNIMALKDNPLLSDSDIMRVQDLLSEEEDAAYDAVIMSLT